MPIAFDIQRIAIHLVDKQGTGLRLSRAEVKLDSYPQAQQKTIRDFLTGHIERAWGAEESKRTRPANFRDDSSVRAFYAQLSGDGDGFFDTSKTLARNLYDLSPSNASRGLLLVLWFTVPDAPQKFLGLFKLDPGRRDQIALDRDDSGQTLLKLAVQSIEEALPEPGDRVLKWALIPHPPTEGEPSRFDLKLRDEQQRGVDPAAYFEKFLGCITRPSVKQEIDAVISVLEKYAQERHPEQDWQRQLEPFVRTLGTEKEPVTPDAVVRGVEKAAMFTGFDRPAFQAKLDASEAREMKVAPARFQQARIRYELEPSGIVVSGPATAMEEQVEIKEVAGGYEIRISTVSLRKKVEP
jgi:nucleoid associated protein NdpA